MSPETQNPAVPSPADRVERLLVFNCHEAWVHQLGGLDRPMDVIVGLSGRFKKTWDEQMRPVPPNARIPLAGSRFSPLPEEETTSR